MIAIIQNKFESNISNKIIRFLEHPTARMMKQKQKYSELLGFDTYNDWGTWNSLYGFAQLLQRVKGGKRAYVTYGGGPEGGLVRLTSISKESLWYVWHREWFQPARLTEIPEGLDVVYRSDDGCESVKLVMKDYELGYEEAYLDDLEDAMCDIDAENEDSDPEPDAESEAEYEEEDDDNRSRGSE